MVLFFVQTDFGESVLAFGKPFLSLTIIHLSSGLLRYARNDGGGVLIGRGCLAGLLLTGCARDCNDDGEVVGLLRH